MLAERDDNDEDMEGEDFDDESVDENAISRESKALANTFNETLSDSINLFQAIHVLQSKEDELAYQNDTSAGNDKN